jgi:2-oxoglutarate ferredoxin oxidoreductase subunit delta
MPRSKELAVTSAWCKGCGICVAFCPEGVLELNAEEKVAVRYPDKCTFCRDCEVRCPDFAIAVVSTSTAGANVSQGANS